MSAPRLDRKVAGKNVTVVGFGRSGSAAAKLAARKGAKSVVVQDRRDAVDIGDDKVLEVAREGMRLELGAHRVDTLRKSDLIVVSPGVPPIEAVLQAERDGVPVISEIELASWFIGAPYIAVTGTNGKSTVTALAGEMIRAAGIETFVGGNLGVPLSEAVGQSSTRPGGAIVLELSSYQLERTFTLRPRVAVLINLTPDHLDRYASMAEYAAAKQRIFLNQTRADHAIVANSDALTLAMARAGAATVHTWGGETGSIRVAGGAMVDPTGEKFPLEGLKIRGAHNVENAMAALLAARLFGANGRGLRTALYAFEGLPHRMQFVADDDGILYLNDSKATNVGAAVKALEGCERRVVLIGGGRHKGGSYAPLRPMLKDRGRALVLVGEATDIMRRELGDLVPVRTADDMFDAVRLARNLARRGDVVLLAPACSSLDMFENYEERGKVFSAAVKAMAGTSRQEEDLDMEVVVDVDEA
ncbi:MAG: UDP-N-acetylmuramoyl-L-alanine--D-glutamate ligase [Deltaproteobacteria bacterium]